MTITTHLATTQDIPAMAAVERAAARKFDDRDVSPARKLQTVDPLLLERSIADGATWVAVRSGSVVGFLAAAHMEGALYIIELDVLPVHQGHGIGSMLIQAAASAARGRRCDLTLTTFSHIPWNRPFYERRGFVEVPDHFLPHLAAQLHSERQSGLENRIAMYFHVD